MSRAVVLFAIAFTFLTVHAETESQPGENRTSLSDVKPDKNKIQDDKVDEIITNKMMRAQTGSKSKFSISNSITYNGGTVDTPFNEHIPNISSGTGLTNVANMTDSISLKYRYSTKDSLLAGFGARWITPFNGGAVPDSYKGNKYDAYNPYVKYQHVYRVAGVQNAFTTGPTMTTFTDLTRMGYVGNWLAQQNSIVEIGHTGLSLGALYYAIYATYNSESAPYRSSISDYSAAFEPFAEYQLSPRLNLRTFLSLWSYEHIVAEPRALTFHQDTLTQSLGLGISVVRDVFLYPNVTFVPYDIRADRTNFGVSANVNLF